MNDPTQTASALSSALSVAGAGGAMLVIFGAVVISICRYAIFPIVDKIKITADAMRDANNAAKGTADVCKEAAKEARDAANDSRANAERLELLIASQRKAERE